MIALRIPDPVDQKRMPVNKPPRASRLLRYYLFRTRRLSRRQLGTVQDWKLRVVFWVGALLVGLLTVAFAWVTEQAFQVFVSLEQRSPLIPLVLTPAGMVFIAWVMRHMGSESQGSGIPQVLVVLKQRYHWLRPTFLSLRVIVLKFGLTCLGLMCGASIGREGPSVQMGAAMMYSVGQMGRLHQKYVDNALIVVTGLVCGLLGGLFSRLLITGSRFLAPYARQNPYRVVFLCALVVVFLGLITGGATYGSGYEQARHLITEDVEGGVLYPLAKMSATLVSYFTGIPGGLFSPSLAAGAGIGNVIGHWVPNSSVVGVTLVAMSAFLAGVIQRPITSFVIVMELTGNRHDILLPLMAGAFLAAAVAKLVWLRPLYDSLADRLQEGEGMALDRARVVPAEPPESGR